MELNFRVVYIFGPAVRETLHDVTRTFVNVGTLDTLRNVDKIVTQVMSGIQSNGTIDPKLKNVMNKVQQVFFYVKRLLGIKYLRLLFIKFYFHFLIVKFLNKTMLKPYF